MRNKKYLALTLALTLVLGTLGGGFVGAANEAKTVTEIMFVIQEPTVGLSVSIDKSSYEFSNENGENYEASPVATLTNTGNVATNVTVGFVGVTDAITDTVLDEAGLQTTKAAVDKLEADHYYAAFNNGVTNKPFVELADDQDDTTYLAVQNNFVQDATKDVPLNLVLSGANTEGAFTFGVEWKAVKN